MLTNPHPVGCPWYDMAEKFGPGSIKYCEATLCSWIAEPANTYTNLGFLLVALLIYFKDERKDRDVKIYSLLIFFLGIASFIYHMSNNFFTQIFDYLGMFCVIYWFVAQNLRQAGLRTHQVFASFFSLLVLSHGLMFYMAYLKLNFQFVIVLAVLIFLVSEFFVKKFRTIKTNYKNLYITLAIFAVGHGLSLLDMKRIWCNPDNHFIQGHALWHLLSAAGFYFAFKYWKQFRIS